MALTAHELFPFVHYEYGEAFYGSIGSMRYRVAREPFANVHWTPADKRGDATMRVTIWPGPYSYAKTEDAVKESRDFPFEESSMEAIASYLNEAADSRDWAALAEARF